MYTRAIESQCNSNMTAELLNLFKSQAFCQDTYILAIVHLNELFSASIDHMPIM